MFEHIKDKLLCANNPKIAHIIVNN